MALSVGIYDFEWIRGTTTPYIISLKEEGVPIAYDDVRLSVYNGSNLAFRLTLEDNAGDTPGCVNEVEAGVFEFIPTAEQTRLLKVAGKIAGQGALGKSRYEVEVRDGLREDVYLMGIIAGIGGVNDDEGNS